jgi:manganese transport protein
MRSGAAAFDEGAWMLEARDLSAGRAWKAADPELRPSLPEANATIRVPRGGLWLRRLFVFMGPGYLISVGYMDPGNWATDLAGGSRFGYTLLFVILLSNLMAILLQALSARLGIVTGRDLAQACRDHYSPPVNMALYITCEIAIIACDLAEVIGTAVALQLLFGIPLVAGALITGADALLVLLLMNKGFRALEAFVIALLLVIAACFAIEIAAVAPPIAEIAKGFVPSPQLITDSGARYLAIGILGATVMPHNLYLHSSIVQTRDYRRTPEGRRDAIRWATTDSTIALMLALFINAAILIIAAAVFYESGHHEVVEISQAFQLLTPLLGVGFASTIFAVALLASGVNSTVTATLAGQIAMEGFLRLRLPPWARRLLTRCAAIVPVIAVISLYDESATTNLLVLSQVILSLQLPFAVVPLVRFVTDRRKMGEFVIPKTWAALAWAIAALILLLDLSLVVDTLSV